MDKNYRRCISCRRTAPKEDFWRIVRTYPERKIELDKGMGRSAYLCPTIECLSRAKRKNSLRKSLRVATNEQIYRILENRLTIK